MAKGDRKNAATTPAAETVALEVPADFALEVHGYTFDANDLVQMGPKGVAYVISNGISQSIVDAAALTKDAKAGKSPAEVEQLIKDRRDKRDAAIRAGEVGHRAVGVRGSTLDRIMATIAEARLKEHVVAVNDARRAKGQAPVALPKGELRKAALAKILEIQGDDIRAAAEAQMAEQKAAGQALSGQLEELGL